MPVPTLNHCLSDFKKANSMIIENDEVHSDASTGADSCDVKKFAKNFERTKEYKKKQKTEMCKNWEMKGACKWGNKCSYAHGEHELVKKTHLPKNYMTRSCDTFHKDGICSFGKRCQFMHSERDVYAEQSYTTVLRENARLAKAKTSTVDEFESNSQIYINVFERKSRLSCFADISEEPEYTLTTGEKEQNFDILSDDSSDRVFEDFGELAMKVTSISKKKSGRGQNKKKLVV